MSYRRGPPPGDADALDLWYKKAIIYSLNVASFMDGNDDDFGELKLLAARLDYTATLGVNRIWLLPFYPSPRRDHGLFDFDGYGYRWLRVDALSNPG